MLGAGKAIFGPFHAVDVGDHTHHLHRLAFRIAFQHTAPVQHPAHGAIITADGVFLHVPVDDAFPVLPAQVDQPCGVLRRQSLQPGLHPNILLILGHAQQPPHAAPPLGGHGQQVELPHRIAGTLHGRAVQMRLLERTPSARTEPERTPLSGSIRTRRGTELGMRCKGHAERIAGRQRLLHLLQRSRIQAQRCKQLLGRGTHHALHGQASGPQGGLISPGHLARRSEHQQAFPRDRTGFCGRCSALRGTFIRHAAKVGWPRMVRRHRSSFVSIVPSLFRCDTRFLPKPAI